MPSNGTANGASNGTTNGHSNGAANSTSRETSKDTPNGKVQYSPAERAAEVAVSPNNAERVPSTIAAIQSIGDTFNASNNDARMKLLVEARRLVQSLETPRETMIKHNWAQVSSCDSCLSSSADQGSLLPMQLSHLVSTPASSKPCWRTTPRRRRWLSCQKL